MSSSLMEAFGEDMAVLLDTAGERAMAYFTTMDVDPGVFQSLGMGFAIGIGALLYLSVYPGEPHDGWELPTEEDRFYALKAAIERETPEELEAKLAEEHAKVEQMKRRKKGKKSKKSKKDKSKKKKKTGRGVDGVSQGEGESELPEGWEPEVSTLEPQPGQATIADQDAIIAGTYEGGNGLRKRKNKESKGEEKKKKKTKDETVESAGKKKSVAEQVKRELERTGGLEERPEDKPAQLSKQEKQVEEFLNLSPLEQEAAAEVKALEQQFGSRENLRRIIKGKSYSDAKPQNGWCKTILKILNFCIPLFLIAGLLWAVNRDYGINVLGILQNYFPREAAVFQSFAGETDSSRLFGVRVK